MPRYSKEPKETIVQKMMPPNPPVAAIVGGMVWERFWGIVGGYGLEMMGSNHRGIVPAIVGGAVVATMGEVCGDHWAEDGGNSRGKP